MRPCAEPWRWRVDLPVALLLTALTLAVAWAYRSVLVTSAPRCVEDLMLGIVTLNQLKTQGFEVVDSAGLDHDQAMQILANHTRRGRGGRGSRIE